MKKLLALILSVSMVFASYIGVFAYSDIEEGTNVSKAVTILSNLGIVDGFEDGTFRPDEKVTRAQMTKLVIGAKNLLAAAETNTTQKFNDVPASHWAVGYVAEGVAQNIINGISETTFDPEATVTFAQATKMLVNACGYDEYAQIAGGWPNGYLTWGSKLGINKGVTGVSNDTELTRGQVAQMIANAIIAPILKVDKYTVDNGIRVPEYKQMNGEDNKFESLLTNEWDTYEVYGRVIGTNRNDGNALKTGEIKFNIEKSDNYNGVKISVAEPINAVSGNSGAENYYLEYAYALINVNDDDEASIVYIESAGKNVYVPFNADTYAPLPSPTATPATAINLYKSETTTSTKAYELSPNVELIINGVSVVDENNQVSETLINSCLTSFENGYLIDSPQIGQTSVDGKYDYITIDTYVTDVVAEVFTKANGDIKIVTDGVYGFTIEEDNENTVYNFILTDGTEIEPTDLRTNDVLSIQADPDPMNYANSAFYNVIVSRDTAVGKVVGKTINSSGEQIYCIGDTEYKYPGTLEMLTAYELYLDKNGDIAKAEILSSSVNYAIVDRYYNNAGDNKVRLILKDGTKQDFIIKEDRSHVNPNSGRSAMTIGTPYILDDTSGIPVVDRFVEYTINSYGEVTLEQVTNIVMTSGNYNARASRIGSYTVSDSAIILNASDFAVDASKGVKVTNKNIFIDEINYSAIFVGQRSLIDGSYPMVVMLTGNTGYTVNSQLQIATGKVKEIIVDGTKVKAIPIAGNEVIVVASGVDTTAIDEGVAFVASMNSLNEANSIHVVLSAAQLGNILAASADLTDAAWLASGSGVQYAIAPVIKKYATGIELAESIASSFNVTNDTGKLITYSPDVKVFCYAADVRAGNRVTIADSTSEVTASVITNAGKVSDYTQIDWTSANNTPAYALVRVYDGDIQEIYSITLN